MWAELAICRESPSYRSAARHWVQPRLRLRSQRGSRAGAPGRRRRWLGEVEVLQQVWVRFSRTTIREFGRPSVTGLSLAPPRKAVLDELEVGVGGAQSVVDEPAPGERADHDVGHAEAVAKRVLVRRHDVVVEATPVVQDRKITLDFQSLLRITALMTLVT